MTPHLHQPEIDRLAAGRLSAADWTQAYRHWTRCELCLNRLIEAGLRGASAAAGPIGVLADAEMPDYQFR